MFFVQNIATPTNLIAEKKSDRSHFCKVVKGTVSYCLVASLLCRFCVSRDVFWYHSIDLKVLRLMEPSVCFLNFVFVSNFSIFVSQRTDLILWLDLGFSPSPGLKCKIFFYWFYIINESSGNSEYGAAKSPELGQCPSSKFFCQNNICMSPVLGSQYGAKAAESSALLTG
jgi:hypothetical protein